ncbi:hypothetical protein DMH04_52445 [Kibdelosporangium aridum]|uniref:Uncharacterized protein n=1 Tax=Kibdelosporangium aridum TaxID=2030 RepID=A0A428Y8F1_KIBAR|nr:hypothetical protein DMH04_52445 [Kibdelosporangium aridum]
MRWRWCGATASRSGRRSTKVEWKRRSGAHFVDATGEVDLGNIDYMKREAEGWELGGDWGDVVIVAQTDPRFLLDDSAQGD